MLNSSMSTYININTDSVPLILVHLEGSRKIYLEFTPIFWKFRFCFKFQVGRLLFKREYLNKYVH